MNKKLLTAAIGAALAAGPMLAQADVKLYGKLHVSVDYLDGRASTQPHSNKATTVSSNASRWGIDVSEKLGGGMKAIAKLEQQINADGETSSQDTRNRYVGLSGKWGTVIAGVNDTPFKDISRTVELFPEYVGDNRNLLTDSGTNSSRGWDLRPSNVIKYSSPTMNGFEISYLYSADLNNNTAAEDNRQRVDSIGVKYSKGPLYVAYAYETHRSPDSSSGTATSEQSETGQRLGASYNFGAFKVTGLYQNVKDIGGKASGDAQGLDRTSWALGGAYTAGNNVFKLQYVAMGTLNKQTATGTTSGDNTGAKMWAIGWDHLFSKTTKMYVAYAKADNETLTARPVNGPSAGAHSDVLAPQTGVDPSAWSVGMIVDF